MALTLGTNVGFVTSAPTADPAGTNIAIDTWSKVTAHTVPADAVTVTEFGWYCDNATEAADFMIALYDNDGAVVPGEAGTRLQYSTGHAKGTDAGWKVVSGLSWDISAYQGTVLWLGVALADTATTTNCNYASSGGAGCDQINSAALNDPYNGGALAAAAGMWAIYALYTTGGGAVTVARGRLVGTDLPMVGASPSSRLVVS